MPVFLLKLAFKGAKACTAHFFTVVKVGTNFLSFVKFGLESRNYILTFCIKKICY